MLFFNLLGAFFVLVLAIYFTIVEVFWYRLTRSSNINFESNYRSFLKFNTFEQKIINLEDNNFIKEKFLLSNRLTFSDYEPVKQRKLFYNCIDINDNGQKLINPKKELIGLNVEILMFTKRKETFYCIYINGSNSNSNSDNTSYFIPKKFIDIFIKDILNKHFEFDYTDAKSTQAKINQTLKNF